MPENIFTVQERQKRYSEQNDFNDDDIDGCIYFW